MTLHRRHSRNAHKHTDSNENENEHELDAVSGTDEGDRGGAGERQGEDDGERGANKETGGGEPKKKKMRMPGTLTHVADTAFKQQRLRAWQPILTPKQVLPTLFLIGLIFAPIGAVLLSYSNRVHEFTLTYTDCDTLAPRDGTFGDMPATAYSYPTFEGAAPPRWQYSANDSADNPLERRGCTIRYDVPGDMQPGVFMYYKLNRYYQNHRRYVKSFDQKQFQGQYRTAKELHDGDCKPLGRTADNKPIYPCGLIANSVFNDTFTLPRQLNGVSGDVDRNYNMTDKGITWSHEGKKYEYPENAPPGNEPYVPPPNWVERFPGGVYSNEHPLPHLSQDEHFMVWMRPAAFPDFAKLYFRNDDEVMETGTYELTAHMNYPVKQFGGKKSIVFTTVTWAGGRNNFLGIAYISIAAFCVAVGMVFTLRQLIRPRRVGDLGLLSWNQPNAKSD
ncbi:hypothetical protein E3P81_03815 [Wallemia ichthyophaga]|nr:hypothetical protein E3P97_03824 [Wallemia ichthyophaga]TIB28262.1 hypothetical protein E3P85_03761 [Wallemia ichthyophaga]TIB43874.1 hypothetical protein E3P82_03821 [Wallemia ichthyophaga]TIB46096.1 hypothetical protein E3P81_03815 [Wallemia ichthyophaga]TIB48416.1 hypothetical protein E3P80_03825 [Wallemia ichthyophaga]